MFIKTSATIDCNYMKAIEEKKVNTNTSLTKRCIFNGLNQKERKLAESVR